MYLVYLSILLCACTSVTGTTPQGTHAEYDYVIVGGGTAGLVVAARLSEDPTITVAVVEAGVHHVNEPLVDTPQFFGRAIGNPAFDWNFQTVPQPALNNASVHQARGKMLGGSSGLNFMAWNRASAKEYDAWEELGATGWNWKFLLPYHKKSETASPPPPQGILPGAVELPESVFDVFHGQSGPIQPSYNDFYSNLTAPYVQTINGLGIPTNSDAYTGHATGIYNTEHAVDKKKDVGQRSYAASTYYNISADRPNLTVFLTTQATKIDFESSSNYSHPLKASGVNVVAINSTGFTGTLLARKEVILSAGAIQTPQMLELSGIGNQAILEPLGIETLIDLPGVGENLQDQPFIALDFELRGHFWTYDMLRNNETFLLDQEQEYAVNHTGVFAQLASPRTFPPFTACTPPGAAAKIRELALSLSASPDISPLARAQYQIQDGWLSDDDVAHIEVIMTPGGGSTSIPATPNKTYVTLSLGLMHPFARGTVHINSSDPLAAPVIDPKYVGNDVDFESMLESVKFAQKIAASPPLVDAVAGSHNPPANSTDEAGLIAYLRAATGPFFHPAGTAAMVSRSLGGVVDPTSLKVYGTSNLRVVDASLVPMQIAAHLQTAVYAIAERASDIIKQELY
ncbi:alcohol oxidase [Trametes versicolor FP-101664 SS1]|uniref:alcohol oxidase n=1 Tax=Trametes versicolor (strain FP-101664) TaxID=717944 RepID=UPI00046219AF|nr:alcohol oxidase [Trametes versicolor FP-101664 SS1]EIW60104.1 alcohol oxidase [Trametes versicolor FP-101664 SS1]